MRSHIVFVSTYPPIVCGVGTYTSYVTRAMPPGRASVVAFDPARYGAPVDPGYAPEPGEAVTYALGRPATSARELMEAVEGATPLPLARTVLWFQHAPDIWPQFAEVLRGLADFPALRVASLHGVHFQSQETPWGLWAAEHRMLRGALPGLDRVTVFTPPARTALRNAFPEYAERASVIPHGVQPSEPLERADARRRLALYLAGVPDAVVPRGAAPALIDALDDPECVIVGALGFLQADKGFDIAYALRDALAARMPGRRVVGLAMGSLRDRRNRRNRRLVARLATAAGDGERFLVTARPPEHTFRAALCAMDLNVYWPAAPTQSGRLAHALGVGAVVIGRDIEGVGEVLREAGAPACADFEQLVRHALRLVSDRGHTESLRAGYRRYALEHCWEAQARRHLELADALVLQRERSAPSQRGAAAMARG